MCYMLLNNALHDIRLDYMQFNLVPRAFGPLGLRRPRTQDSGKTNIKCSDFGVPVLYCACTQLTIPLTRCDKICILYTTTLDNYILAHTLVCLSLFFIKKLSPLLILNTLWVLGKNFLQRHFMSVETTVNFRSKQ